MEMYVCWWAGLLLLGTVSGSSQHRSSQKDDDNMLKAVVRVPQTCSEDGGRIRWKADVKLGIGLCSYQGYLR